VQGCKRKRYGQVYQRISTKGDEMSYYNGDYRDEYKQGRKDEERDRRNYDYDQYSGRERDEAYFAGRRDQQREERSAEERREEERQEEERQERLHQERLAQQQYEEEQFAQYCDECRQRDQEEEAYYMMAQMEVIDSQGES
jgi:hypothetical protein